MKRNILLTIAVVTGLSCSTVFAQINTLPDSPDTTFGVFTEITPPDSLFVTPPDEDFWVISTAPADYDNDGDIDIAVLGFYVYYNISAEDMLVLMRNDGPAGLEEWDFTYISVPLGGMSSGASDMAWGDYDGDGDLDLTVGSDGQTVIYRNDSATLVMTDPGLPGYWEDNDQAYFDLRSLAWGDYDNDGDADLVIPSIPNFTTFTWSTALIRNDGLDSTGGWNFTEIDSVFAETMHAQSLWADFDTDGDLDLLLVNHAPIYDAGFFSRYRNDGNGVFLGENILGSLSIEHGEAQWGDYDDDGDLDILVAGNLKEENGTYTPMALRIYRNDSTDFIPVEVIPNPAAEGWFDFTAATWADYDSDGDMDILLAGHYNSGTQIEGRARIYMNVNGIFTDSGNELPAPHASGDRGGTFTWLDIDGDGDLDYFIAGEYFVPGGNGLVEAQMHLYRNDAPGTNEAPMIPAGLNVTQVSESEVLLSWQPGSDDHTPSEALTYDLKLFRNNVPVLLPAHTPEPGNVSAVTEWSLTGLDPGNYTWTLNTIDAAYIASAAATGEFSLGVTAEEEISGDASKNYSLSQNFPNPFSGRTTITYSLPQEGTVSLRVLNSYGAEVSFLDAGLKQAGAHSVPFDASGLSDGIYICTLQVNDILLSRKMMVINGD